MHAWLYLLLLVGVLVLLSSWSWFGYSNALRGIRCMCHVQHDLELSIAFGTTLWPRAASGSAHEGS
eukprot:4974967-Amphidinium_carterae.1